MVIRVGKGLVVEMVVICALYTVIAKIVFDCTRLH